MNKWMMTTLLALVASGAAAEGRVYSCVSNLDGTEFVLNSASEEGKGSIATVDIAGDTVAFDAQVLKGVGSVTFLSLQDEQVLTYVVNFSDMTYDLSIKGQHTANDSGKCQEGQA